MKFEKISGKTLRQRIYDQLRRSIISGDILPGESISLKDLSEQFDVSIMPVREALWQLESEKIIVINSNRSIHVNKLTAKEMEEALQIRIILETQASRLACERRPESAVKEVKILLDSMISLIKNPKKYIDKNSDFHLTIYSYSESPMLLEIINMLWARVGPYFIIHATNLEDLYHTVEYHKKMFGAFANRDKRMITEAVQQDLENAARLIIPHL